MYKTFTLFFIYYKNFIPYHKLSKPNNFTSLDNKFYKQFVNKNLRKEVLFWLITQQQKKRTCVFKKEIIIIHKLLFIWYTVIVIRTFQWM